MSQMELQRVFDDYAKRQEATRRWSTFTMVVAIAVTIACLALIGRRVHSAQAEVNRLQVEHDTLRAKLGEEIDQLRAQRDQLNGEIEEKTVAVTALHDQLDQKKTALSGIANTVQQSDANPKAAIDQVRVELASEERSTPAESAQATWSKGYGAYNAGRYDEAEKFYRQALKADPNFAPALNSLGRIAFAENDLATAENYFRESMGKQADYVPAINNLARIELRKRNYEEAERLVADSLRYRPGYAPAEQLLKEIHAQSARSEH